ncbi:MAG: HD domain-containing protein, partial [Nitrospira sp.]|nr:HD domain-containing protein [Nitrospira sp.]
MLGRLWGAWRGEPAKVDAGETASHVVPSQIEISLEDLAKDVWLPLNLDFIQQTGELVEEAEPAVSPVENASADPEAAVVPAAMTTPSVPAPVAASSSALPASPPEGGVQTATADLATSSRPVSSGRSSALIRDFIMPYQPVIESQRALEPLLTVVKILEEYGDCPSIVTAGVERDEECTDLYSIRDTLAKVTLRDHTYRVTELALALLNQTYRDGDLMIPKVLAAALGHDLGKIPRFRATAAHAMGDHPVVSAIKLQECFAGTSIPWFTEVLDAIKGHHRIGKDRLGVILRQADGQARVKEMILSTREMQEKPLDSWCAGPEVLAIVAPRINRPLKGNKWAAFSLKGVVYVTPDALLEAAKELARQKKIVEMGLIRSTDREETLRRLVKIIGAADLLAMEIGEHFYGRPFDIFT